MKALLILLTFFILKTVSVFMFKVLTIFHKPLSDNGSIKTENITVPKTLTLFGKTFTYYVDREMLLEDINDKDGICPKGYISDGASIPSFAQVIIGGAFASRYKKYAFIHDFNYSQAEKFVITNHKVAMANFYNADKRFYKSLRDSNRKIIAYIFYKAVRIYSTVKYGVLKRQKK